MRKSNYDKYPSTRYQGFIVSGWEAIKNTLSARCTGTVAVELYTGTFDEEIRSELSAGCI